MPGAVSRKLRNRMVGSKQGLRKSRALAAQRQGGLCFWCGVLMTPPGTEGTSLTADHLISPHLGGSNEPENIVAACRACNNRRGNPSRNHHQSRVVRSAGNDAPHSPFQVLAVFLCKPKAAPERVARPATTATAKAAGRDGGPHHYRLIEEGKDMSIDAVEEPREFTDGVITVPHSSTMRGNPAIAKSECVEAATVLLTGSYDVVTTVREKRGIPKEDEE